MLTVNRWLNGSNDGTLFITGLWTDMNGGFKYSTRNSLVCPSMSIEKCEDEVYNLRAKFGSIHNIAVGI